MTLPLIITVNVLLDLAVVLAVFAIIRFTHRLHHPDASPETLHLSEPLPLHVVLTAGQAGELARAA